MQNRNLFVLGTASQVPTKNRNHIGFFLQWDKEGILFDPGEGTQRQLLLAGISASRITKICITHFHGDHCLGLPGVIQRLSLDRVAHVVDIFYPASGQKFLNHLMDAAAFYKNARISEHPISAPGKIFEDDTVCLQTRPLAHGIDTWGYRFKEHDSRTILPHYLPPGLSGQAIGELKEKGKLQFHNRTIFLEEVSAFKPGQSFAYVMDTRPCQNAVELARDVDMLVCESTYLESEEEQALNYNHLTAAQASEIASQASAKKLVLAHYSRRYPSIAPFALEAGRIHQEVIAAQDGDTIEIPKRKRVLTS